MTSDGVLHASGVNNYAQLGIGSNAQPKSPQRVVLPSSVYIRSVSCGYWHSIMLDEAGEVFSCGDNSCMQLGLGGVSSANTPTLVTSLAHVKVISVVCAAMASFCLTEAGVLYAMGNNSEGTLGVGTLEMRVAPRKVAFPTDAHILAVAAGWAFAAALTEDGRIFTWGAHENGQLGRLVKSENPSELPAEVEICASEMPIFSRIACGAAHVLAAKKNGDGLFVWGYNSEGELGLGDNERHCEAERIKSFEGKNIVGIEVGSYHSLCIVEDGQNRRVFSFGLNERSQLCLAHSEDIHSPVEMSVLGKIRHVVCGGMHSLIILENGELMACGSAEALLSRADSGSLLHVADDILLRTIPGFISRSLRNYVQREQTIDQSSRTADFSITICSSDGTEFTDDGIVIFVDRCFIEERERRLISSNRVQSAPDVLIEDAGRVLLDFFYGEIDNVRGLTEDTLRVLVDFLTTNEIFQELLEKCCRVLGVDFQFQCPTSTVIRDENERLSLADCMLRLYKRKEVDGDVTLVGRTKSRHKAHRFVLISRREYFRAMFQGGFSESATNVVEMEMALGHSFDVYLCYLYTGFDCFSMDEAEEILEFVNYFDEGGEEDRKLREICLRILRISNASTR